MKAIYKLLKLNNSIKNYHLKAFFLFIVHLFNFRHLFLRIDPTLTCNIKCTDCKTFVNNKSRLSHKSTFTYDDIGHLAEMLFPKALQAVIGCRYEPTISKHLSKLIQLTKKHKIPFVGLVTNGQALSENHIETLIKCQIEELTLSLHGLYKSTYEKFMVDASYDKFFDMLTMVNKMKLEVKSKKPSIRINFVANSRNIEELKNFFHVFDTYNINTLQIRPMNNSNSSNNLTIKHIIPYRNTIRTLIQECKQRNITLLANKNYFPKDMFEKVHTPSHSNPNQLLMGNVYRYISPQIVWLNDFKWKKETYGEFCKRIKYTRLLWKSIFLNKDKLKNKKMYSNSLNYNIYL